MWKLNCYYNAVKTKQNFDFSKKCLYYSVMLYTLVDYGELYELLVTCKLCTNLTNKPSKWFIKMFY